MKTPLHQLARVLAKRSMLPKLDQAQFAREIAAYLLETSRTGDVNSLAREMVKARTEQASIVEVTAVSAHELSDSVRSDIRTLTEKLFPQAKYIVLNERQEADIIGGVRLELPDAQLDLTVRGKLNRFKTLTT